MSAANNISLKLSFNQVLELVKQLPESQQKKLVDIIKDDQSPTGEKKLTTKEKKLLKGIDRSVDFINNYKKGAKKHLSLNQVLDEL